MLAAARRGGPASWCWSATSVGRYDAPLASYLRPIRTHQLELRWVQRMGPGSAPVAVLSARTAVARWGGEAKAPLALAAAWLRVMVRPAPCANLVVLRCERSGA